MGLRLDSTRVKISAQLDQTTRSELGQYMTPDVIARFMASLFTSDTTAKASLLDAGAGIGTLSAAFLDRWLSKSLAFEELAVTAYELDSTLAEELSRTLASYSERSKHLTLEVKQTDFIEDGLDQLQFRGGPSYTHAILNPPYGKIRTRSRERKLLQCAGIETVNLYSGFVALALALLRPGGQLVAITPRSFCNGPYFRPFREFVLQRAALTRLHLFDSRKSAFRDDSVLQENIIFVLRKDAPQGEVAVSHSTDETMRDYACETYPFARIVQPWDTALFIHVPGSLELHPLLTSKTIATSLADLRIQVSTGPVVHYRAAKFLCQSLGEGCFPLLYPMHFESERIRWPQPHGKKPNAIRMTRETRKHAFPSGHYVLVRRFSSKEEKRRIVAAVASPAMVPGRELSFENHLNVFHHNRQGLAEPLAYGLMTYLNSSPVDELFRSFSGHTQVNVADLQRLPYPNASELEKLGKWAMTRLPLSQDAIDRKVNTII